MLFTSIEEKSLENNKPILPSPKISIFLFLISPSRSIAYSTVARG